MAGSRAALPVMEEPQGARKEEPRPFGEEAEDLRGTERKRYEQATGCAYQQRPGKEIEAQVLVSSVKELLRRRLSG